MLVSSGIDDNDDNDDDDDDDDKLISQFSLSSFHVNAFIIKFLFVI